MEPMPEKQEKKPFEGELTAKAAPPEDKGDDSWKVMKLVMLADPAIPPGIIRCLEAAGIFTIGDLSASAPGPISRTVKGVGVAAQAKVEAALDAFWQQRRVAAAKEVCSMAKYIRFEGGDNPVGDKIGMKITYRIVNKRHGDMIGAIVWHPPWRRYVFMAAPDSIWSRDCLADVQDFMRVIEPFGKAT